MTSFLAYFDLTVVGYVAVFAATLAFSQKIKDWFKGIPSEMRATLTSVEASALGNVKVAQRSVLAQLSTALPPLSAVKPPVVTATVTAPAAAPAAPVSPVA